MRAGMVLIGEGEELRSQISPSDSDAEYKAIYQHMHDLGKLITHDPVLGNLSSSGSALGFLS